MVFTDIFARLMSLSTSPLVFKDIKCLIEFGKYRDNLANERTIKKTFENEPIVVTLGNVCFRMNEKLNS